MSGLEVVLALAKDASPQTRPWRVGAKEETVGEIHRIHPRVDRTFDRQPRCAQKQLPRAESDVNAPSKSVLDPVVTTSSGLFFPTSPTHMPRGTMREWERSASLLHGAQTVHCVASHEEGGSWIAVRVQDGTRGFLGVLG